MSQPHPKHIDRREAVRRLAAMMGGALSAPTLAGLLAGCEAPAPGAQYTPRALSEARWRLVEAIADVIIPATDTPGASQARVHDFIDMMLADFYSGEQREFFLEQIDMVDVIARDLVGSTFGAATDEDRTRIVALLDAEAFPNVDARLEARQAQAPSIDTGDPPFMRTMKELTVTGYYTSEIGQTVELHRPPFAEYRGDIPLDEVGRTWA